jgi:tRNA nucleotidyltransferase (CCA-adding enzyme)
MLYAILNSQDIPKSINDNLDMLLDYIPEMYFMIGFQQKHPHHHLDVFEHTLLAMSLLPEDACFSVKVALLFHDIGKPFSYQDEGNIRHFRGHAEVSYEMTKIILKRFGYKKEFIDEVCYLVREHDTPITDKEIANDYDLAYKKFIVQKCDALAHNPEKLEKRKKYLDKVNVLFKEYNKI